MRLLRQLTRTPGRARSRRLQNVVCRQILTMSRHTKESARAPLSERSRDAVAADETAALVVLPEIVALLRRLEDDAIRTHLMAALVNYTYFHDEMKKEVMKLQVPKIAVEIVRREQDSDLVRQACSLLSNRTSTIESCQIVAASATARPSCVS